MFCYLDFRCYFETNGQNHIHFRLVQVLKDSTEWHFLTFTSPSSKLEIVYPPWCGVEEQMLIFSSGLTPGRVKKALELKSNPQVNHRTHIWKTPACLKFSCRKFATKKTLSLGSERCTFSPTELPRVFICVVRSALVNIRRKALLSVGFRKPMTSRSPRSFICDSSALGERFCPTFSIIPRLIPINSNKKMPLAPFKGCFDVSGVFLLPGEKNLSVDVTE